MHLQSGWAIHELLSPRDVTCPLAIVAMAIYSKDTGRKIEATESMFKKDLSVTEIKPRVAE